MYIEQLSKDKHYRFFEAAYWAALSASGAGRNNFRLGAALVHKKKIIAVRHNEIKTHPKLCKFTEFPFLHAESSTILSVGMDHVYDHSLYVVRILRDKSLAMAKPCSACQKLLDFVGIKVVYFTTVKGYDHYEPN